MVDGTLLGAGIGGAAGAGVLAAANIGLVLASPVAATLLALGYGAAIGSLAGAVKSLRIRESDHAAIVQDALKNNHWAVIVHAHDKDRALEAQELLSESAAEDMVTT